MSQVSNISSREQVVGNCEGMQFKYVLLSIMSRFFQHIRGRKGSTSLWRQQVEYVIKNEKQERKKGEKEKTDCTPPCHSRTRRQFQASRAATFLLRQASKSNVKNEEDCWRKKSLNYFPSVLTPERDRILFNFTAYYFLARYFTVFQDGECGNAQA